jgi:type VI secretion system protein ImpH
VGEWSELYDDDRVALGGCDGKMGQNNALGVNTLIGSRVYCVESRFRIVIGPLTKIEFERIKPGSSELHDLCEFARGYVGPNVKFDLKIILDMSAASRARLSGPDSQLSNLGWNTWLMGKAYASEKSRITEIHVPSQGL